MTIKVALPLQLLRVSTRRVVEESRVSRYVAVQIALPVIPSKKMIAISAETRNTEGEVTREIVGNEETVFKVYFSNTEDARKWNEHLSELLDSK